MTNMISYKDDQDPQPLFDYYVETDLDNLDDQPIDYSKRYSDQDSYEDRRRKKENLNSNQSPTPDISQVPKPSTRNSHDEVKIFCMEGTPVTISSASSFCDLREVGAAASLSKSSVRRSLPSTTDEDPPSNKFEEKKGTEPFETDKEESPSKEREDINKEGKTVSFRESEDISKASSPMMFSRSSSVCSLNSFDQHSIVDDRSSVSAISALTSGIISPSELPDSPSELMCPDLTEKTSSPKMDVSKKQSSLLLDTSELSSKVQPKTDEVSDINNKVQSSDHMQIAQDFLQPNRSEEISEDDANDILGQQFDMIQADTSMELDEVFTNPEMEKDAFILKSEMDSSDQLSAKSDDDSDGEDILLQQCIQLGMPSKHSEMKLGMHKEEEHQSSSISKVPEAMSSKNSIGYENSVMKQSVYTVKTESPHLEICTSPKLAPRVKNNENVSLMEVEITSSEPHKSEDSDDDDELLQQCIKLGMPTKEPQMIPEQSEFLKPGYLSKPMTQKLRKDLPSSSAVSFDDEDSDGDDILLQQCIERGMPNKPVVSKVDPHMNTKNMQHNVSPNAINSQVSCVRKDVFQASVSPHQNHKLLSQRCLQYGGIAQKVPLKSNGNSPLSLGATYQNSVRNNFENVVKKQYPSKSEFDSDGDEDDILLQQCIQLGMPKDSPEKRDLKPKVKKTEFLSQPIHPSSNDLRDDCPDGTSDGDEDDDILAKCIRAGMPSPKTVSDVQSRLLLSQSRSLPMKKIASNNSYMTSANIEANKKFSPRLPPNQPYAPIHASATWLTNTSFIDVDSMRIYQTEDTPILSPSASISDLSSLSFNESFLNNSRNSNCSSDSDDDELLRQCIRSGMPEPKKTMA